MRCVSCGDPLELTKPPSATAAQWQRITAALGPRRCLRCLAESVQCR